MNRKFLKYCLYSYCGLSAYLTCLAQGVSVENQIKAPQPPFINKLPHFARYEMVLEPGTQGGAANPKGPAHFTKIQVTKTDDIKLINAVYSDGSVRDIWARKGDVLYVPPGAKTVYIYSASDAHMNLPFGEDDFFDLRWLSASNYKGIVSYGGAKCYLFESGGGGEMRRALVDVTTKLPQMVSKGITAWRFTYDPAPSAMLQFPPAFAKVWADSQAGMAALSSTCAFR